MLVQRDSFICAQSTAQLNIALVKKLGAGFFGGEGFILEKLTGPGTVFIHAGGDFVEFTLNPGEVLQVDTGCIVAFDETRGLRYPTGRRHQIGAVRRRGSVPGDPARTRARRDPEHDALEAAPRAGAHARGGDERSPLGAIGDIFSSDD